MDIRTTITTTTTTGVSKKVYNRWTPDEIASRWNDSCATYFIVWSFYCYLLCSRKSNMCSLNGCEIRI